MSSMGQWLGGYLLSAYFSFRGREAETGAGTVVGFLHQTSSVWFRDDLSALTCKPRGSVLHSPYCCNGESNLSDKEPLWENRRAQFLHLFGHKGKAKFQLSVESVKISTEHTGSCTNGVHSVVCNQINNLSSLSSLTLDNWRSKRDPQRAVNTAQVLFSEVLEVLVQTKLSYSGADFNKEELVIGVVPGAGLHSSTQHALLTT